MPEAPCIMHGASDACSQSYSSRPPSMEKRKPNYSLLIALIVCGAFWSLVRIADHLAVPVTASVGTDHAPSLTEFVNDEMRLLAPSEKYALDEKLNQFNHETSIQMAIAILAEPTDADLQEFTIQVADCSSSRSKESRGLKSATAWKARYPIWWRIGC